MYFEIGQEMIKYPYVTTSNRPIEEALIYMKDCNIRHLPVVDQSGLIGIVSERDILSYRGLNKSDELTVGDIMCKKPYVTSPQEPLTKVLQIMATEQMGSALVVDGKRQLVGIFTTTDALLLLAKIIDDEPQNNEEKSKPSMREVVEWNLQTPITALS